MVLLNELVLPFTVSIKVNKAAANMIRTIKNESKINHFWKRMYRWKQALLQNNNLCTFHEVVGQMVHTFTYVCTYNVVSSFVCQNLHFTHAFVNFPSLPRSGALFSSPSWSYRLNNNNKIRRISSPTPYLSLFSIFVNQFNHFLESSYLQYGTHLKGFTSYNFGKICI